MKQLIAGLFFLFLSGSLIAREHVTYELDYKDSQDLGKLEAVYDTDRFQRYTFFNGEHLTVMQVGLTFDPVTKTFIPDLKQVIKINIKTPSTSVTQK